MRHALAVGAVVLAMSATPALARGQKHKAAAKPVTDHSFVMEAAKGGLAEVELGQLAEQKASSQQVKDFGKKMVEDHGKANQQLQTLAQNKNITLPTTLDQKDQALKDRLSKLSGDQFDRAYMRAMVKDHTHDVSAFRTESQNGKDTDVKQFASSTLPTLEDHLKLARTTDQAVVGTSGQMTRKSPKKTGK